MDFTGCIMQLNNELHNGVFDGWKEGHINFPPTYKYGINSDVYVGENRKEGEKKRSPAWYVILSYNPIRSNIMKIRHR